jgi:hypothetical protein
MRGTKGKLYGAVNVTNQPNFFFAVSRLYDLYSTKMQS